MPIPEELQQKYNINKATREVNSTNAAYPVSKLMMVEHISINHHDWKQWLASCQGTDIAVLPIHTKEERKYFRTLEDSILHMTSQSSSTQNAVSRQNRKSPNFTEVTRIWNMHVKTTTNMFYKLPEHLEAYYKYRLESREFQHAENLNDSTIKQHRSVLESRPKSLHVPPASSLPGIQLSPITPSSPTQQQQAGK